MVFTNFRLFTVLIVLAGLSGLAAWSEASDQKESVPGKLRVYIGTYTWGGSKGIYQAELDLASGQLGPARLAAETVSPSFLAIHPDGKFLYSIGEIGEFRGKKAGVVSAFSIDATTGKLTLLNQQSSGGPGPCHVNLDRTGRCALVANYSGGSVASLPIGDDGLLREAASFIQHVGAGVDPRRQEGPHAHCAVVDPANRFAFVADLGLDKVFVYRLDAASGTLSANEPASTSLPPGSGPRHLAFHPNGRYAYVINEMKSTLAAMSYDAEHGVLKLLGTLSTLPAGFTGNNSTAEVEVHPSGKFVYGSNRGHGSIAIFAVDEATGKLRYLGVEPTRGKNPRSFGIDPTGKYLLAADQDGNNVVVFRIDGETGKLLATGSSLAVSAPVCVKFMKE